MRERTSFTGKEVQGIVFCCIVFVFLGLLSACETARKHLLEEEAQVHHLVILHTNDTHGHPLKFLYGSAPDVGGLPARATLVREIKRTNENVLLLDGGDLNTGRAESNLHKARPDIEGYNAIGYDAMVLGNHEFDNPPDVLKAQMAMARFPFLSANIKTKGGQNLAQPYLFKEFPGFKVAILGLTTRETRMLANPEHVKELLFEDEVEIAKELVPRLKQEADVVIALTHAGIFESSERGSRRLASEVGGIDIIVDGHTHTRLDFPILVDHPSSDHRTLIVQAWKWGLIVGRLDLWIVNRKVVDFRYEIIPVNLKTVEKKDDGTRVYHFIGESIPEDQALLSLLQPYADQIESLLSDVIGYAEVPFLNHDARQAETALGNLIADSMKWHTENQAVDFAIQNGGGIRDHIPKGPITKKTIYDVLPFDNSIVLLSMKGGDVQRLFDFIAAIPSGEGAFPQVSEGVTFTINRSARRCENVLIKGKPIDINRIYRIATNSYLANGGDGYQVFLQALEKYDSATFQQPVLIEYIKSLGGRIKPKTEGRISLLSERLSYTLMRLAA
jgi:5'-nucleotidase/UDP-sugar diphosphatase